MLHGPLLDKIFSFAIPLAASSILQQVFNSADVAVVGRFASSKALAAVGSNAAVINLLISLFMGLSVGANVVIATYIGQQKKKDIQGSVHTIIVIALVSGIFLLALGMITAPFILVLMNTPDDIIDLAALYLRIYFLSMPFIMVYNFGSAILRSKGDSKRPLYCLIVSGIINVILNLIFVIVFNLSVAGVAIATVISNIISSAMVISYLLHEEEPFRLHLKQLSIKRQYLSYILKIGLPAGVQGMVFSLSNVCIQTAINSFGSNAVAGSAAAINFEYFTYFIVNAFSQAAVTFTSQNYGARKYNRCKNVFRYSMTASVVITTIMSTIFMLTRNQVIKVYTADPTVILFALIRMTYVLSMECFTSSYEISGATLRGMGYSMLPTAITVAGSCLFRLAWVYTIFEKWRSFSVLMAVYPVSWAITGIAMLFSYFILRKKLFAN